MMIPGQPLLSLPKKGGIQFSDKICALRDMPSSNAGGFEEIAHHVPFSRPQSRGQPVNREVSRMSNGAKSEAVDGKGSQCCCRPLLQNLGAL